MARHAHVARQPIYDRRLEVVGYELLFRDQGGAAFAADPDAATSSVILEILSTLGLERLVGPHVAHVDVTRSFLSRPTSPRCRARGSCSRSRPTRGWTRASSTA